MLKNILFALTFIFLFFYFLATKSGNMTTFAESQFAKNVFGWLPFDRTRDGRLWRDR